MRKHPRHMQSPVWSNQSKQLQAQVAALQGNLLHIQERVDSTEQFPLPSLGKKLQAFREDVVRGRGFFLIR